MYRKFPVGMGMMLVLGLLASGCRMAPKDANAKYLSAGKKYMEKRDYRRAVVSFKNAARVLPADAESEYQLAVALIAAGDPRAAVASLNQAIRLDPKHLPAQLKLAEMMAATGDRDRLEEAQKRAQSVLTASPDNPEALRLLALTEFQLGRQEDAIRHLERALAKAPDHLKSVVALSSLKLSQRDFPGAEKVLKDAVQHNPKSAEMNAALGHLYMATLKLAEAEPWLKRASELDPTEGRLMLDLVRVQNSLGHRDQAEKTVKALSSFPNPEFKPLYGLFLYQGQKPEAALAEFTRLLKADPKDRQARSWVVMANLALGRNADAEKILTETLRKNPRDAEALEQRAQFLLLAGRVDEAHKDLMESLRFRPDSGSAHQLLAKVYQARGAALSYRQELTEALRYSPDALSVRLELSQALRAARDPRSAQALLDKMVPDQKAQLAAVIERNWVNLDLGNLDAVRASVNETLPRFRVPDLYMQDAILKTRQKDVPGAQRSLEEALKITPENLAALQMLAESYLTPKDSSESVKKVRAYAAAHPQSAQIQYFLGNWLIRTGNPAEARSSFLAARKANPAFLQTEVALARLDLSEGKIDSARQTLNRVLAGNKGDLTARFFLGVAEEKAGNYPAAVAHLRAILEVDPRHLAALNNLASILTEHTNQLDEGLKYAQQVKELVPTDPFVDDTIGWAYYRKGIYQTAVRYLEGAVKRDPGATPQATAVLRYHLAMAYLKLGDVPKGERTLQAALQVNPGLPEAKMARDVLAESKQQAR